MFEITDGLADHQVLQRDKKNLSRTIVSGKTGSSGRLYCKVSSGGKTIAGWNYKKTCRLGKGRFEFTLAGIRAGGPYEITLRFAADNGKQQEIIFRDILVGDVWILGGQSNMEGVGYLKDAARPNPAVRAFYMYDRWATAKDPIHNLGQAVDAVHTAINGGTAVRRAKHVGAGPGVSFGIEMHKLTGVPQGLIACAHGGTSMDQWDPKLKKQKGMSLYGATVRRFIKNGSNVAGVIWYQGCSDTNDGNDKFYTFKMKKLIAAFRRDFNDSNLPITLVQISRMCLCERDNIKALRNEKSWNAVQDQQRLLQKKIKNVTVVPAIDLLMDDAIHISGKDQQRLGRRLAQAAFAQKSGSKNFRKPIELKSIRKVINKLTGEVYLEVSFTNVVGALRAEGTPWGFAIVHPDGSFCDTIYRVDLKGSKAIVRTAFGEQNSHNLLLQYGYGTMPYCNITDQADRSLPVFGPVKI